METLKDMSLYRDFHLLPIMQSEAYSSHSTCVATPAPLRLLPKLSCGTKNRLALRNLHHNHHAK